MIYNYCLGDATEIDKFSKRLVKVTSTHTTECKELLKLMGIPYVEVCFNFTIKPFRLKARTKGKYFQIA